MSKLIALAAALALLGGPALAQQTDAGGMKVPSAQNSGAGIAGQPGNKNGPPPRQTNGESSTASKGKPVREQDAAKIPGKAGGKSGPAVMPPGK